MEQAIYPVHMKLMHLLLKALGFVSFWKNYHASGARGVVHDI